MRTFLTICFLVAIFGTIQAQLPQQCAQIAVFTQCTTDGRQRVDKCSQNLNSGGVPGQSFYDCQCKELTSIASCYWYCNDSPEILSQLPTDQANAKAWCDQAENMRRNQLSTTTTTSKTVSIPTTTQNTSSTTTTHKSSSTTSTGGNGGEDAPTTTTTKKTYGPSSTLDLSSSSQSTVFSESEKTGKRTLYMFIALVTVVCYIGF